MSDMFFQVDQSVESVPAVIPVKEVNSSTNDAVKRILRKFLERENKLSIIGNDPNMRPGVYFKKKNDEAQISALRNPWYSFVIKVAGFSNEDVSKLWKDIGNDKNSSQPLANTPSLSTISQIDAAAGGKTEEDEKRLGSI